MTGFCVVAWPGVDERLCATVIGLLLDRQVLESTLAEASHVFLLIPVTGDEADSPLSADDERIIPVVVGESPSTIMPERSQLVVPERELPHAADRLADLTRLTGAQLVAVNRLRNSARHWSASGREVAHLLAPNDIPEATQVLLAGMSAAMADETTSAFVEASRGAAARRVRRQAGALATAVIALLGATILAVQLSLTSQQAAHAAREREAEAQSIRLAGQAETLLADESDPDLPWLLADAALRTAATQEAEIAARMVTATIPEHRSLKLAKSPALVEFASASDTVAVAYEDGSVDVFDDRLAPLRGIAPSGGAESPSALALSDDGRCVALASGPAVSMDCDGVRHQWDLGESVVGSHWTGDHLVVVTSGGIYSGAPEYVVPVPLAADIGGEIFDASFTADGSQVALAAVEESRLLRLSDGEVLLTGRGGNRTAVHPSGEEFLVRDSTGVTVLVEMADDTPGSADPDNPHKAALVAVFPGGPYLVTPRTNTICAVSRLEYGFDSCFTAHQGVIVDVVGGPDGMLASIGSDRYVRVWSGVQPRSHVALRLVGSNIVANDFDPRQTNQVAWNSESGQVVALQHETGILAVFDDLKFTDGRFYGVQLGNPIALSRDGAALTRWYQGTSRCRTTLAEDWPALLEVKMEPDPPPRPHYMAPASDCSVTVACYEAECYRVDASGSRRITALNPIGLGVDRRGLPEIHHADGSAQSAYDRTALGANESAVSATSLGDQVVWVTPTNRLRTAARWGDSLELLQLPRVLNVLRVELLADGDLVAVHSSERILVAGTRRPGDLRYVGPGSEAAHGRHDVTVTGDGQLITVSPEFGLKAERLEDAASLRERLSPAVPRDLTSGERDEFGVTS